MNIKPFLLSIVLASTPLAAFAEMVNINEASAKTLQHYLSGIGEKKAASIVKYRSENKEFKEIADIMKVKGIGEGIYKKIKADLSLKEGKVAFIKSKTTKKKVAVKIKKKKVSTTTISNVEVPPNKSKGSANAMQVKQEVQKEKPQLEMNKSDVK